MASRSRPKRIAVIATVYTYLSHAQHFADRFMVGYPYEGRWHTPNVEVASLYVDKPKLREWVVVASSVQIQLTENFGVGIVRGDM